MEEAEGQLIWVTALWGHIHLRVTALLGVWAAKPRLQEVAGGRSWKELKAGNSLWRWGILCYKLFCFGFFVPFNFISPTLRWEWRMLQCHHSPIVKLEIMSLEWWLFACLFLGVLETADLFWSTPVESQLGVSIALITTEKTVLLW